jgi:hypothetical protein
MSSSGRPHCKDNARGSWKGHGRQLNIAYVQLLVQLGDHASR